MAKNKPVSQSRTMWVAKGTEVGGKTVKKGYLAQYGRPEKKVSARVKLVEGTNRGKAGDVVSYKQGRYYKAPKTSNGSARTSTAGPVKEVSAPPPVVQETKTRTALSQNERAKLQSGRTGWSSGARRQTPSAASPRALSGQRRGNVAASKSFRETQARASRAAGRRQATVSVAAAVASGQPVAYGARAGLRFATSQVTSRLPRVTRQQAVTSAVSGARSAWSSAERWWKGY